MKKIIILLLIFCLAIEITFPAYAATLTPPENSMTTRCENITNNSLRIELNKIMQEFFVDEAHFNLKTSVDKQWKLLRVNSAIDSEIDRAIDLVDKDTRLTEKFKSSWSSSKAEELTGEVIELAFNSQKLNNKIELLSSNIADEIANKLELISIQSSSSALDCLQRFIGRQYSTAVVAEFNQKIENSLPDSAWTIDSISPNNISFLKKHRTALGGTAILLSTALIKRTIGKQIAQRVTQRIAGRVVGRLGTNFIPFVGSIVGGVLLTSDFISSFNGTLPQIQDSLKAEKIKQMFKDEIVNSLDEEIRDRSPQIARELANEIYAEWLDFKQDYHETLNLIADIPEFKDTFQKTADKSKIYSLVGILLNNVGRTKLKTIVRDDSFTELLSLPEVTYRMLGTTDNPQVLIEWNNLAGNRIKDVVDLEIYKHLSLEKLNRQMLKEILSIKDSATISKLSLLEIDSLRNLLAISTPNLIELVNLLSAEQLQQLSGYLPELKQHQTNQFIRFILDEPTSIIENPNLMHDFVESRDIDLAIKFWQSSNNLLLIVKNIPALFQRSISWGLFIRKYGLMSVLIVLVFLPLLVLLLLSIFLGRRWLNANHKSEEITTNSN